MFSTSAYLIDFILEIKYLEIKLILLIFSISIKLNYPVYLYIYVEKFDKKELKWIKFWRMKLMQDAIIILYISVFFIK